MAASETLTPSGSVAMCDPKADGSSRAIRLEPQPVRADLAARCSRARVKSLLESDWIAAEHTKQLASSAR
jgi:hypothetical protein